MRSWLRFPSFTLEPLEQLYRGTGGSTYRYQSGTFTADLEVSDMGLVTNYGGVWQAEAIGQTV